MYIPLLLQLVDRNEEYAVPTRNSNYLLTLTNRFIYGCVAQTHFHQWTYESLDEVREHLTK